VGRGQGGTERHRDTETQRHRDTETQRHRDTETERHRDRGFRVSPQEDGLSPQEDGLVRVFGQWDSGTQGRKLAGWDGEGARERVCVAR
jgi:hypothetical protein